MPTSTASKPYRAISYDDYSAYFNARCVCGAKRIFHDPINGLLLCGGSCAGFRLNRAEESPPGALAVKVAAAVEWIWRNTTFMFAVACGVLAVVLGSIWIAWRFGIWL